MAWTPCGSLIAHRFFAARTRRWCVSHIYERSGLNAMTSYPRSIFYWWFRLLSKARSLEAHTNEITIRKTGWRTSETRDICTTGWQPENGKFTTESWLTMRTEPSDIWQGFCHRKYFKVQSGSSILLTRLLFYALESRRFSIKAR